MVSRTAGNTREPRKEAPDSRSRARRAVSRAAKTERRESILAAADRHFRDVGFERFSMEVLARELGMARGTLYRYFGTREELLLTLYRRQQQHFVRALLDQIQEGISDETFVRLFYETSRKDPTLIALRLRLTSVIEHNVNMEVLVETKRSLMADFDALRQRLSETLRLSIEDAGALIVALLALILGAAQADASPVIDPSLLPDDVRELMTEFHSEPVFVNNALLILEGLRRRR